MTRKSLKNKGFTIVELLVVIVIIGVLATIVTVSYTGITKKTVEATLKNDLKNAIEQLELDNAENNGIFPATIELANDGAGLKKSPSTIFEYVVSVNGEYCLTATATNADPFYVSSDDGMIKSGTCPDDFQYGVIGWKQVSGGGEFMCGIKTDNLAYCWGAGYNSQIGNGSTLQREVPMAVSRTGVLGGKTIKTISTGASHACAIASDDKAYCWGMNDYGQLGDGTSGGGTNSANRSTPVAVVDTSGPLNGKTIRAIATGTNHTCVIASDYNVYCWGRNNYGELGNGNNNQSSLPVAVTTSGVLSGKKAISISSNYYYVCIVAENNLPYCWGQGMYGILGNGLSSSSNVPVAVNMVGPLSGRTVKSITAGYYHTCVIADNDLGYCWGYNDGTSVGFDYTAGALGNGTTVNSMTPVAISMTGSLIGKTFKKIDSDSYHSCALASDNLVYCWGYNGDGELGVYSKTDPITVPTPVHMGTESALNGKTVRDFATGDFVNCAIANDGVGACWGWNHHGGYGNNTSGDDEIVNKIYPVDGMFL